MTKEGLVEVVQKTADLSKKQSQEIVNAIFEEITKKLSKGEEVAIAGFGSFKTAKRAARMGVNPKTGEKIKIAAKTVAKFRPAKALKDAVA